MNYTHIKKVKKLVFKNKVIISNELEKMRETERKSICGLTNSQIEYKKILNSLLNNSSILNRIKILLSLNKKNSNEIRILFLCNEFFTFMSYLSVYDELNNDKHFVCDLVYLPFFHSNKNTDDNKEINEYRKHGLNIINYKDYDICDYSPDVVFYLKAYDLIPKEFYIDEMKYLVDKIIYIPYAMEIGSSDESIRYQYQLPLHKYAWKCLSYSQQHYENACKYSELKGKNYWPIGHPRMDLTKYSYTDDKIYKQISDKSKNRIIFMYNPHFTIDDGDSWGTFKKYGMDILKYFSKHNEIFLIYRPHPFLKKSLEKEYENNTSFWKEYNSYLSDYENIYYDDGSNYLIGMKLANILISDANSFIPEFLLYNKPVIYTKKENSSGLNSKLIEKMTYVCNNINDVYENIEHLVSGNDKKGLTRLNDLKNIFFYDENISVAKKVKNEIINKIGGFDE